MMGGAIPRLAITTGEPAGIGPELIARLAHTDINADLVVIGDPELLQQAATNCGLSIKVEIDTRLRITERTLGSVRCVPVALSAPVVPGILKKANADYVIETLTQAFNGCTSNLFDAVVTAPVHKGIINEAGIKFTGHTEFFAERTNSNVVMMLTTSNLRVALATTHLPLVQVPVAITSIGLTRTLRVLHSDLQKKFGISKPRVAVLGLNPHAGEGGYLGQEEINTIIPVLEALRAEGMHLIGPLPADTAFIPTQLAQCDAVLAMYHDQGLPVLKAQGFGGAVNITLGLPFIRTSVDHGTALDLAGKGQADPSSLIAATQLALELVYRQYPMVKQSRVTNNSCS